MPSRSKRSSSRIRYPDDGGYVKKSSRGKKHSSSRRRERSFSDDDDSDYSGSDDGSSSEDSQDSRFLESDNSGSESDDSSRRSLSSESDVDTASEDSSGSDEEDRYDTTKPISSSRSVISKQRIKNAGSATRLSMAASLALQRRKKESPQLKMALDNRRVREVDYHKNVTGLYTHIENQRWREVAERCRTHPVETKTWVYRMDKVKKNILWRMLPIHTAVLYRAPVYVLLDLITAYPEGPSAADDRRMLPAHMACRIVCKEDVLRLLLKNAPQSVFAEDIKGRTPRDFLAESKRENKSKVLQKVNERNRKNLLKILKEYEQMKEKKTSSDKSVSSRRSSSRRRGSDASVNSFADEYSTAKRNVRSRSKSGKRIPPSPGRGSRRQSQEDFDDNMSYSSRHSRSSRVSRSSRRNSRDRDDDDMSRASRKSRSSRISRAPRLPPKRSSHRDDDDRSQYSRRSRSSRNAPSRSRTRSSHYGDGDDDDDASRASSRSKSSRVSRTPRFPEAPQPSRNSKKQSPRLPKMPQKAKKAPEVVVVVDHDEIAEDEENETHEISTVKIERQSRPESAGSAITQSTDETERKVSDVEEENDEEKEQDSAEGSREGDDNLEELWLELEEKYPIPQDFIDESVKADNDRKTEKKKEANELAAAKIKYYEPPKELQKLLVVINSSETDESFKMKKRPSTAASTQTKTSRAPLMPGRENGASRRVNACGALKALSKNEKNRLRLGRTKGVVHSLCNALRDPSATNEERFRCSNTLMFLSVPKKNWEAIFNADRELLPTLTMTLHDDDPRVRYNASFCIFLLAKSEANRYEIFSDVGLMTALVEISDIEIATDDDDDQSVFTVDGGDLTQKFQNLGSPSGIRQQGSPTSEGESKRGARLCALKAFLSFAKLKEGAQTMIHNNDLVSLLMRISGTMTAEENLLCMAIIANLTRDTENITILTDQSNFMSVIERGLSSRNVENRKCATMALQNLSCKKEFRVKFAALENVESITSLLGKISTTVDDNAEMKEGKAATKAKKAAYMACMHEGQVNAIRTIKNLSIEPMNMIPLTNVPGVTASLVSFTMNEEGMEEKENIEDKIRYISADALANMSQWLNGVATVCAEKNNIDLRGRSLDSLKVSTWNQWD